MCSDEEKRARVMSTSTLKGNGSGVNYHGGSVSSGKRDGRDTRNTGAHIDNGSPLPL